MSSNTVAFLTRLATRFLLAIAALLGVTAIAFSLYVHFTGQGYFWRALSATYLDGHVTAHIDDARNFPQREIASGASQPWPRHPKYNSDTLSEEAQEWHRQYQTAAFLVIQDGQLRFEQYFSPYTKQSATNSFSMAKTVTTMQIGAAIEQGLIPQFDTPLVHYLPEYKNNPRAAKATVAQLSSMTSGHDWDEQYYMPLNIMTELYFSEDAETLVLGRGFEREPASAFEYSSGSSQLLGVVLRRALQAQDPTLTISRHLSETFWKPLGMEQNASYGLDLAPEGMGLERAYCCIHSNARDFAKFGQLLLQDGAWNGQQILAKDFVERMRTPTLVPYYGHSLWLDLNYKHPFYFLQGHLGQYVIVVPSKKMVIVRLGQTRDKNRRGAGGYHPQEVYDFVDEAVRIAAS